MHTPVNNFKTPTGIVFLIGFVSTIGAVSGYDVVACRGVIAGIVSALMRLSFLVFVSPSALIAALVLFDCCVDVGLAVGALPIFRERKELLLLILPVTAFLVGMSVASSFDMPIRCSLSPWR